MYYYENYTARRDIFSYMVFKRRKFGKIRRTIMRGYKYRPKKEKLVTVEPKILGNRVEFGIFSYSHYCPYSDPKLEVWFCKIPSGSRVYSNGWEYMSDRIIFLEKC